MTVSSRGDLIDPKQHRPAVTTGTRVLIVEDDTDTRHGMRVSLAGLGHELAVATNASEAIQRAVELQPTLVLLDLGLPGAEGLEVLEELQRIVPKALVVVLSAWDEGKYERAALDAGAVLYVEKPITGARLASVVETLLR